LCLLTIGTDAVADDALSVLSRWCCTTVCLWNRDRYKTTRFHTWSHSILSCIDDTRSDKCKGRDQQHDVLSSLNSSFPSSLWKFSFNWFVC
jgi:hypothetical protein